MSTKIELGDTVKDIVSGVVGVAIARTTWIAGCDRITIQPKAQKNNTELPDNLVFDEPLLEIVKKKKVEVKKGEETGGPVTRNMAINYGR